MFTGIVAGTAEITRIIEKKEIRSFSIDLGPYLENLTVGASVSIDGVCLTVVSINGDIVDFDVIDETLRRTTMSMKEEGDNVNIERSLKFGDELGGHILSGHIMTKARILEIEDRGEGVDIIIEIPEDVNPYIMEKGYIAVDGISLTIGSVSNNSFELHIIPETLRVTTIGQKDVGEFVNLEIDSQTQSIVQTIMRRK
jgi:riboflavin synthase